MLYHLTYKTAAHPMGLTKEEVQTDPEVGGCTAVLIGSILYPESGEYSALFVSRDGRTGAPLSDAEVWKAWIMLAAQLGDSETLPKAKREVAAGVFEAVADVIRKPRGK